MNLDNLRVLILDEADDVGEEHRLKYRYIDLRRPQMQRILMFI